MRNAFLAVGLSAFVASSAPLLPSEDPSVVPIGHPLTVWAAVDTLHKCGIIDVPDVPPRLFQDDTGLTHMIVGAPQYHRMSGPSPLNLTRDCDVAWNGSIRDPDPAKFAWSEFLNAAIAFDNGTIVSLLDDEYYACPPGVTYPYCYWLSTNLAVSHDWGYTWQHARLAPNHLVATTPYKYNASWLASGWGGPSNIVRSPKDGFYYTGIWNKHQAGLQAQGTCFMRTANLMDPSSWRSWGGSSWNVSFVSPYTMEPGTEAEHICTISNLPPACNACGLVWSAYLMKFVTTMYCLDTPDHYLMATSQDLIHWSEAKVFYTMAGLPAEVAANVTSMFYPTLVDIDAPLAFSDRNFYTIGQEPYLYWVSIGHSPHTDGRRLWATKLRFEKNGAAQILTLV